VIILITVLQCDEHNKTAHCLKKHWTFRSAVESKSTNPTQTSLGQQSNYTPCRDCLLDMPYEQVLGSTSLHLTLGCQVFKILHNIHCDAKDVFFSFAGAIH